MESHYTHKILVSQGFLTLGKPEKRASCPIALALRAYGYRDIKVGNLITALDTNSNKPRTILFNNSPAIQNFVTAFDKGEDVEPFVLVLETTNEDNKTYDLYMEHEEAGR